MALLDVETMATLKVPPKPIIWYSSGSPTTEYFWTNPDSRWIAWRKEFLRLARFKCANIGRLTPAVCESIKSISPGTPICLDIQVDFAPDFTSFQNQCTKFLNMCNTAKNLLAPEKVACVLVDFEAARLASGMYDNSTDIRTYQAGNMSAADSWLIYQLMAYGDIIGQNLATQQHWYQSGQLEDNSGDINPQNDFRLRSYGTEWIPQSTRGCTLYMLDRYDLSLHKLNANLRAVPIGKFCVPIISCGASYTSRFNGFAYESLCIPAWNMYQIGQRTFEFWENQLNSKISHVALYPGPGDTRFPYFERNFIQLMYGATRTNPIDKYKFDPKLEPEI